MAAVIRACLPESAVFLRARAHRAQMEASGETTTSKTRLFLREVKNMLKKHWILCIYAVLLMTGMCVLHDFPPSDIVYRIQLLISRLPGLVPNVHPTKQEAFREFGNKGDHHR